MNSIVRKPHLSENNSTTSFPFEPCNQYSIDELNSNVFKSNLVDILVIGGEKVGKSSIIDLFCDDDTRSINLFSTPGIATRMKQIAIELASGEKKEFIFRFKEIGWKYLLKYPQLIASIDVERTDSVFLVISQADRSSSDKLMESMEKVFGEGKTVSMLGKATIFLTKTDMDLSSILVNKNSILESLKNQCNMDIGGVPVYSINPSCALSDADKLLVARLVKKIASTSKSR